MSLPTADDLFRPTVDPDADPDVDAAAGSDDAPAGAKQPRAVAAVPEPEQERGRRSSGRVRHDEKMTVYVTADELVDIEHARLTLRRHHGLAVDRGRLVREALALVLADLEAAGADSALVQRLLDE